MKVQITITVDTDYDNMAQGKSIKEISEEFKSNIDPGVELISIKEIAPANNKEAQGQPTTSESLKSLCISCIYESACEVQNTVQSVITACKKFMRP